MTEVYDIEFPGVMKVTRDMLKAFGGGSFVPGDIRAAVDLYYQLQDFRKSAANQGRALEASGEPHEFNDWALQQFQYMENVMKRFLDGVSLCTEVGKWARSQKGIGPVIAAGLNAHISLEPWRCAVAKASPKEKACKPDEPHGPECKREIIHTVGHIWRFAGLDPTAKWEKGQRRPWNAQLKTLCWKIGESFVKVSGDESAFYGAWYKRRKAYEIARNEAGEMADQAAGYLAEKKYAKDTTAKTAYESGRLPDGQVHARAARWTAKLFLAHWHDVAYRDKFGKAPPSPYPIAMQGHAHVIPPPDPA